MPDDAYASDASVPPALKRHSLLLADPSTLESFAVALSSALGSGDSLLLHGDLGSGKTTFTRALIRALSADPDLEVPSPTFSLVQVYQTRLLTCVHADLYRLESDAEVVQLDLFDRKDGSVLLLEWPDRARAHWPSERLDMRFDFAPDMDEARRLDLDAVGLSWQRRLGRSLEAWHGPGRQG